MEIAFDFTWNIGDSTPHWYQVESQCAIATEESVGFDSNDPLCSPKGQNYVQQIMARNAQDLCKQLNKTGTTKKWPLKDVKRSSAPAYKPPRRTFDENSPPPEGDIIRGMIAAGNALPGITYYAGGKDGMGGKQTTGVLNTFNGCTEYSYTKFGVKYCSGGWAGGYVHEFPEDPPPPVALESVGWEEIPECLDLTVVAQPYIQILAQVSLEVIPVSAMGLRVRTGTSEERIIPLDFNGNSEVTRVDISADTFELHVQDGSPYNTTVLRFSGQGNNTTITPTSGSWSPYVNDVVLSSYSTVIISGTSNYSGKSATLAGTLYLKRVTVSGGVVAGGAATAHISKIVVTGNGGVVASGSSGVNWIRASGGIDLGSSALVFSSWWPYPSGSYDATGGIMAAGNVWPVFNVVSSSGISTSGTATLIFGPEFICVTRGTLRLRSPGDLGELFTDIAASFTMAYFKIAYPNYLEPTLSNSTVSTISSNCGCSKMPQNITIQQDLNRGNELSSFLQRNHITFTGDVVLRYSGLDKSWKSQHHFVGIGKNNVEENWTLIFELRCLSESSFTWQYSVSLRKRNMRTDEDFDTKILCGISANSSCFNGAFALRIDFDTRSGTATAGEQSYKVTTQTFFDEIGVFKDWTKNPVFKTVFNPVSIPAESVRYDISSIFPTEYLV